VDEGQRGFFYLRLDSTRAATANVLAPDGRQRLFFHRVGRKQADDQLVYENREHPDWRLHADVSEDGQYLVIALRPPTDTRNRLYFIDLDNPSTPTSRADRQAIRRRRRVLRIRGERRAAVLRSHQPRRAAYARRRRGHQRAGREPLDIGRPGDLRSIDRGTARRRPHRRAPAARRSLGPRALFARRREPRQHPAPAARRDRARLSARTEAREIYFAFTTFLQPPVIYRFDLDTRATTTFRDARADSSLAPFETTRLFYTSKDGVRVPMLITARRGITLNGTRPTLLQADGAFGRANTPRYSPLVAAWLQQGGIYAIANVRGGGDDGQIWHDGGRGTRKQTSVDDLVAAAEFLVNQRYTRPTLLGLIGHGSGGMLAAAAVVQHPELFGAAALDAGLFDMVRYTRFTIGWTWESEFGSPDNSTELRALTSISPLNGVHPAKYPATLLTVGEYDDVIPPLHSYKFGAALQAAQTGPYPVLLRVEPTPATARARH